MKAKFFLLSLLAFALVLPLLPGCKDKKPCEKTCDTPPAAHCSADDISYVTYADKGVCRSEDEGCVYEATFHSCPNCQANCLKKCENFTCSAIEKGNKCRVNGQCAVQDGEPFCHYQDAINGLKCNDGICYNGECVGCYNDNQCNNVPSGTGKCWNKKCDNGTCAYNLPSEPLDCKAGSCKNGYETPAVKCGVDGSCMDITPTPVFCNGFACSGTKCVTACSATKGCISGYHCKDKVCVINDTKPDADTDSNTDSNSDADTDSNTDSNSDADTDSNTDSNSDADTDSNTDSGSNKI